MAKFVIDEDMPCSTGLALMKEGHEAEDVRDHGYRGSGDDEIYRFSQEEKAILLTGGMGFSNILKFPLGQHFGIVVARFPNEMAPREINREIVNSLRDLGENDFKGNLIILEPGRIRIRRVSLLAPWLRPLRLCGSGFCGYDLRGSVASTSVALISFLKLCPLLYAVLI